MGIVCGGRNKMDIAERRQNGNYSKRAEIK